ncbi:MAG: hypothetical protein ACK4G3_00005, partial [bacterium]
IYSLIFWGNVFTFSLERNSLPENKNFTLILYFALFLLFTAFFTSVFFFGLFHIPPSFNLGIHLFIYILFNPGLIEIAADTQLSSFTAFLIKVGGIIARILPHGAGYYALTSYEPPWESFSCLSFYIHNITWILFLLYMSFWRFDRISLTSAT